MSRDPVIDFLRGYAIIAMVLWHSVMWFGPPRCDIAVCSLELNAIWYFVFFNGSYLSVPIFYFTAGVTLARNLADGKKGPALKRAFRIIVIGYALTFFVMGSDKWLYAWVLQSIGGGLLLMAGFSRWRAGPLMLYGTAILCVIKNIGLTAILIPDSSKSESLLPFIVDCFRALLIDGGFPILPWTGFIALGYGLFAFSSRSGRIAVLGVTALIASAFLSIAKYPMSLGYLFFFSGTLVLMFLAFGFFSMPMKFWLNAHFVGTSLTRISRNSLEIFVFHYILGHSAATMLPSFRFSFAPALALGSVFLLLTAFLLAILDRSRLPKAHR